MAGIEVIIGADNSDLSKKIEESKKELEKLKKDKSTIIKIGGDVTAVNKQIHSVSESLVDMRGEFEKAKLSASSSLSGISSQAASVSVPLQEVGGDVGEVAKGFDVLSTVLTGGVAGAIQGITTYFIGLYLEAEKAKNLIRDIKEESTGYAIAEVQNVKSLISIAQDKKESDADRLKAVHLLQDSYPTTFKNLSEETIMTKNLSKEVNELTKNLIAQETLKGLSPELGKLYVERIKLIRQYKEQIALGAMPAITAFGVNAGAAWNQATNGTERAGEALEENKTKILELQRLMGQLANSSFDLLEDPKKIDKVKKTPERALPFKNSLTDSSGLIDTNQIEYATGKLDEFGRKIKGLPGQITSDLSGMNNAIKAGFDQTILLAEEFNAQINDLITNSISGTFENLGAVIGDALSNGGNVLQAVGQTLIASLGAFLSDMGSLLIKYGTLAVVKGKLDLAILSGGPVSIAAGLAAIGVGILLKAAGGAIGNAAKSGGSASTGADYSSPASSSSSGGYSGGGGYGRVVFEISGQSLIGVLSNTLDKNQRLGGSVAI